MTARTSPTPAPTPLDDDRVTELVTRAAYERLRSDLAVAHGTELVSWDEQNPKMRGDLRESPPPSSSAKPRSAPLRQRRMRSTSTCRPALSVCSAWPR